MKTAEVRQQMLLNGKMTPLDKFELLRIYNWL